MHGETHLEASVRAQTPWLNSLGLQYVGNSLNHADVARFTDKSDPMPIILEYRIGRFGQHMFKLEAKGIFFGMSMCTQWFDPLQLEKRLAVMREYTDVIRPLVLVNMDKAKQNDERTRRPGLR